MRRAGTFFCTILLIPALAGCASSTFDDEGALVKRIGAFGTATTTQLAVAEKIFEEKREDESIVAERRAAMVAANAFYDLSSCVVTPVAPPAATEGNAKPQPCQPRPVVLAAEGAAPFAFPPENIRVNAVLNGPRIAAALRDYAASLVEVVEAEDSDAILASTRTALENAKEIAIGVNTARGRPDIPEARLAVFDTASETLPTYLANALNAVKYRMLESVVLEADGAVQAGTHQIATALDALEDESASEMEDALVDAGRELEDAFDEDAEARLARLTEIEEMAAEFRELNDARAALKVGQIAQAHAALAKRFREPDDFAALAESVTAINELVTSTDALVKSIEEAVTAEPDPPEEGQMTPQTLIDEANSLAFNFQQIERKVQACYRGMRFEGLKCRDAGDTAGAQDFFDRAQALSDELDNTRSEWRAADDRIDRLLLSDAMTAETIRQLEARAKEARGHLEAVRDAAEDLQTLADFTTFLRNVVGLLNTILRL